MQLIRCVHRLLHKRYAVSVILVCSWTISDYVIDNKVKTDPVGAIRLCDIDVSR